MYFEIESNISNKRYVILAKKSNKARRIRISINSQFQISLIVPRYQSYKVAKIFLLSKVSWIDRALIRIKNRSLEPKEKVKEILLAKDQVKEYSKILIDRCKILAKKHNIDSVGTIKVRSQKTLWGSCSRKNNISLNINLIKLKQELIDYVILHELTHCRIKNHSKKFWKALEKISPDAKLLNKQLRQYSLNYRI